MSIHGHGRTTLMIATAFALTTGLASGVAASRPSEVARDSGTMTPVTGVGETMLIVVGGEYPTYAAASDAAAALDFGDVQGFYIDATDNYRTIGLYEQTSPDLRTVECASALQQVGVECPPGLSQLRDIQPVSLRYVPLSAARLFLGAEASPGERCGAVDLPPCTAAWMARLLSAEGYQLAPGQFVLLSAFRTKQGAQAFVESARMAGAAEYAVLRVRKLGGPYVGLGQEPHPDGKSGPLLAPLPNPDAYQE